MKRLLLAAALALLLAATASAQTPGEKFALWWKNKYNASSAVHNWRMHVDTIVCKGPNKRHRYDCHLRVTDTTQGVKQVWCAVTVILPSGEIPDQAGHVVPCKPGLSA